MSDQSVQLTANRFLLVVVAGLVLLAGCGDEEAEPAAPAVSSSSTVASDESSESTDADADESSESDDAPVADADEPSDETADDEPDDADAAESDYPPFEDIDPATDPFFTALEITDVVDRIGEQEIYERGVTICRDFDNGTTLDAEIDRLLAAGFGDDTALLMAAAVTGICPQHVDVSGS